MRKRTRRRKQDRKGSESLPGIDTTVGKTSKFSRMPPFYYEPPSSDSTCLHMHCTREREETHTGGGREAHTGERGESHSRQRHHQRMTHTQQTETHPADGAPKRQRKMQIQKGRTYHREGDLLGGGRLVDLPRESAGVDCLWRDSVLATRNREPSQLSVGLEFFHAFC